MFLLSIALITFQISTALAIFVRTFEGLMICGIINKAAEGFGGTIGYILESRPLLFLGKISYGLYLYHNFVPSIAPSICNFLNMTVPTSIAGEFAIYTFISLVIATISWYVIEKPILSYKDGSPVPRKAEPDVGIVLNT